MALTETMRDFPLRSPTDMDDMRSRTPSTVAGSRDALQRNNSELPRAASYTYMPAAVKEQEYTNRNLVTIKGSFSEADLIAQSDDAADISPPDSSGWTTPDEVEPKVPTETARDLVAELQKSPKIFVERQTEDGERFASSTEPSTRDSSITTVSIDSTGTGSTTASTPRPRMGAAKSFSRRFNRNSWYSNPSTPTSRSPSPAKPDPSAVKAARPEPVAEPPPAVGHTNRKSFLKRRQSNKQEPGQTPDIESTSPTKERRPLIRRSTTLKKLSKRASSFSKGPSADDSLPPPVPAVPSLPKSFSTDRLPTLRSTPQADRAAPVPRLVPVSERTHPVSGIAIARKKDELWGVFRTLDGDYAKFSSKSVAFKANVVRTSLLPFLRTYAAHASNSNLRPEDLDRRTNILNKWWTGMIEMLHGRNNQSISGTDRPAILDGISGVMERPEWRLAPSPFAPLHRRLKGTQTPMNHSTTSLTTSHSEFLTESVYHNVRNIFIQNLSSQMAFVVDKMSLRNASASLVTFCGKACAYAFMFVPGMADVLVRLWDLPSDTLRRVLSENGIEKFDNVSDISDNIVSGFPPALQNLGFISLMKMMRKLRTPPPLPLGTNHVQWWGYWLERWTGRESDLFYVFVKHFHVLVTDFLPADAAKKERMCVPGLLLVHAQILANLDSTIHRDAAPPAIEPVASGPSPTFDDVLADPDAVASALPVLPANATRIMAENRLIMLIRDFLSQHASDNPGARALFAESFNDLLQCAARGTSIYDHAACYTLLDFLEEALSILVRFEHLKDGSQTIINSDFWQTVCKKMISSENTITEIRLYSFLYTVWNTVVCDLGRKADLCTGLLLDPQVFESRFNHWCPMVRAYYMRLLCWRVGRFDGDAAHGDVRILETMHDRLSLTWSHYLWLREQAAENKTLPPPTNPCNPAPSRRLLIIRTDTQVNPAGSFLSFDGIVPPTPTSELTANKRFSTLSSVVELDSRPESRASSAVSELESPKGGLRGFLRNMMGTSSKARSKSQASSKNPSPERAETKVPAAKPGLERAATDDIQAPRPRASGFMDPTIRPAAPSQQHRNFSFKFSLEFHPGAKAPGQMRLFPPRLPLPAQQFLQTHTQKANGTQHLQAIEPKGVSRAHATYTGRALAEWMMVVGECQSFFERRKNEGVPMNKFVETPVLGVEVFKRPG